MVDLPLLAKDIFLVLLGTVLGAILRPYIENYISEKETKKKKSIDHFIKK
jgi:fluoride ion exporter CrcB/FEX